MGPSCGAGHTLEPTRPAWPVLALAWGAFRVQPPLEQIARESTGLTKTAALRCLKML